MTISQSESIVALALSLVLVGCGVSGVEQAADAVVLDQKLPRANTEEGAAGESHRDEILVGTDEKVPVRVEWSSAKDTTGCLRVQQVKLTRTGGATSTEIYDAKVKEMSDGQCVGSSLPGPGGGQPDLIDRVSVSFCWRWNGAANTAPCAYSGGFIIPADAPKVEGPVERPPK